jgi:CRISPR-associated protein Cmr5
MRAQAAWTWVGEAEALGDRYGTLAAKLPSLLQVSGLGQTLAFLYARGYDRGKPDERKPHGLLVKQLGGYVQDYCKRPKGDPMETLLSLTPTEYRAATKELMAIAEWLKRFAEGRLGKDETKESRG